MSDRQDTEPRLQQVAALPWRIGKRGGVSIMLVTSRTNGKWMLPKGWPMAGKTDAQAALQEAREEAGVDGVASELPIGSYYYLRHESDGSTRPAQAVIYSVQVTAQRSTWDEKGQRRRRWFKAEKAAALVFERDLGRFLANVAAGRIVLT
jgi:8-oxo-dGTP pyrophosphatase MutT (NUDIX family)